MSQACASALPNARTREATPGAIPITLSEAQLEVLADLIAARLRSGRETPPQLSVTEPASRHDWPRLASARELARRLDVDVKSIYRHADELGAIRVGRRLRFDPDRALAAWPISVDSRECSERSQTPKAPVTTGGKRARRRTPKAPHCRLLPVGRS